MNIYFSICFIIFDLLVIKAIFSALWVKFYFLHYPAVFNKKIEYSNKQKISENISNFINHMDKINGFSRYTGKIINNNLFFFRKKLINISFIRNDFDSISGTISIDEENKVITIKGHLGNSLFIAIVFFIMFLNQKSTSSSPNIIANIIALLFIGLIIFLPCFFFEKRRFKKLVSEIEDLI